MSIDFRAALERLVELDDTVPHNRPGWSQEWSDAIATARAVLAEREVVSVVDELSDEKLLELAQFHYVGYILRNGTMISPYQEGTDIRSEVLSFARAVLARWGHQPTPPAEGEVGEGPSDEELLATLSQAVADFPPRHPEAEALCVVEYEVELELRKARAVWDRARQGHQLAPQANKNTLADSLSTETNRD